MSNETFIPVTSDVLEEAYNFSEKLPFETAEYRVSEAQGTLFFLGKGIRVAYGISYSKDKKKYILFVNYDGSEFMSFFPSLDLVFSSYGLDFERFRYLSFVDLNAAATRYRGEKATKARTNSER